MTNKGRTSEEARVLLPWYLNGTLSADERRVVEAWLRDDPQAQAELAAWQHVRLAADSQPQLRPSPAAKQRVMAQVQAGSRARPAVLRQRLSLVWGAAMALSVLILSWFVIQPGIGLQWSVVADGDGLTAFRIYRAPAGAMAGNANFGLLMEVPAQSGVRSYTYVDTQLLPGQSYVYRVEGIGPAGELALSQAISANALSVLPLYLMILLASALAGYSVVLGVSFRKIHSLRLPGA